MTTKTATKTTPVIPSTKTPTKATTWTAGIWADLVLAIAGLPTTKNNVGNLLHWMAAESTGNNTGSTWDHDNNPLNVGSAKSATGSAGFATLEVAAINTANEIDSDRYSAIYNALKQTAPLSVFSAAVVHSTWSADHYGGTPTHIADSALLTPSYKARTPIPPQTGGTLTTGEVEVTSLAAKGQATTVRSDLDKVGLGDLATFIDKLEDLTWWKRVGIFVGGAALVVLGIVLVLRKTAASALESLA